MIRAVVWKEVREQAPIGLTLLLMGSGVLASAAAFGDPPATGSATEIVRSVGVGRLATLMLAVTAGVVCGGALFAAEREAGTMGFLESLPVSRGRIWRAKLLAGFGLAAAQIAGLLAVSSALGLLGEGDWSRLVAAYSLLAFAWGTFGSTLARTTLGSIGVALPFAIFASLVYLLLVYTLFGNFGTPRLRVQGTVVYFLLMFATPLGSSALLFTRPDRLRLAGDLFPSMPIRAVGQSAFSTSLAPAPHPPQAGASRPGWGVRVLLWLAGRQAILPGLIVGAFALAFGFCLLLPTFPADLLWPPLALVAGVLAGVTIFADEQGRGVARFWAEQRLPIGRLWCMKVGVHGLLALGLLLLLAVPSLVRAEILSSADNHFRTQTYLGTVFHSRLFDELQGQTWKYLLAPVGYGFALGHLCGLLFRKAVVAAGVAGMAGGSLAALWIPSLLSGGLSYWQVFFPVVALLATTRLLMRSWTSDRLPDRRSLRTLVAGSSVAALLIVAGIGYRALEVPDAADAEADLAFVNGLPAIDANLGGREFRSAAERFSQALARDAGIELPAGPQAPTELEPNSRTKPDSAIKFETLLESALVRGWPTGRDRIARDAEQRFDQLFERDRPADVTWYRTAVLAAALPIGVYEDPRRITTTLLPASFEAARLMGQAILVHGLREQHRGEADEFATDLLVALNLAKTLRTGSVVEADLTGNAIERAARQATARWLERWQGPPDRLRKVLALWTDLDAGPAFDPTPYYLAERYLIRTKTEAPTQWLPDLLSFPGSDKELVSPEVDLVAIAWTVPWERERLRRLLGVGFEQGRRGEKYALIRNRPGSLYFQPRIPTPDRLTETARRLEVGRRATLLKLALVLYESSAGHPAAALADLVPLYLPALPPDPYAEGQPFHYRLSTGEELEPLGPRGRWGNREGRRGGRGGRAPVVVPPGQSILWSIGPEARYAEGRQIIPPGDAALLTEDDFTFLVPLRRKPS